MQNPKIKKILDIFECVDEVECCILSVGLDELFEFVRNEAISLHWASNKLFMSQHHCEGRVTLPSVDIISQLCHSLAYFTLATHTEVPNVY
jgi:hypothetical protein